MGNDTRPRKRRAEASNADKYDCPNCYHMNGERNLKICMTCSQGDKFVYYQNCSYGGIDGRQFP